MRKAPLFIIVLGLYVLFALYAIRPAKAQQNNTRIDGVLVAALPSTCPSPMPGNSMALGYVTDNQGPCVGGAVPVGGGSQDCSVQCNKAINQWTLLGGSAVANNCPPGLFGTGINNGIQICNPLPASFPPLSKVLYSQLQALGPSPTPALYYCSNCINSYQCAPAGIGTPAGAFAVPVATNSPFAGTSILWSCPNFAATAIASPTTTPTPTPTPTPGPGATPTPLATLYVNNTASCPGSGTTGAPYCNIQNAFNAVAAGGDIRIRNSGVNYNEEDTLTTTGTVAHPIIIESDNAASPPTLTETSDVSNSSFQMELSGVSNVYVQNLKWDGTGLNVGMTAIKVQPTSASMTGINILTNTINNWAASNTTINYLNTGNKAIWINGNCGSVFNITATIQGNTLTGNRYSSLEMECPLNVQVLNNTVSGGVCGIVNGSGASVAELGNEFFREDCLADSGPNVTTNTLYQGNNLSNMNASCPLAFPTQGGSYGEWAGLHVDDGCAGMTFQQNTIHDFAAPATHVTTYTGVQYEQHTAGGKIMNNLVYNFTGGASTGGARAIYVSPDSWVNGTNAQFTVAGNTVYNMVGGGGDAFTFEDGVTGRDNLALNNGGVGFAYLNPVGPVCSACTTDYNIEWDAATGGQHYGRVDFNSGPITFAAWKTATSQDSHSVNADPLLISPPSNLALQSTSPALHTGIAVSGLTVDYVGVTRANPPSMGAYESSN